ncbi:DUF2927 domain-containing protein [Litchfieldia alkalitelluris]|uniref:DUF2927 domain-containing protein n=1 Tax=Litchfieldia alkalitelluris TaxID=304268 RepID=UPI000998BF38|nr:DUF2927 domain-containing protein [Litchfieldia alkalitelluris]
MKKTLLVLLFLFITGCSDTNDIVQGIEDGKIYVSDPTINIDENFGGSVELLLNGKEIESGHKVTENGNYTLVVTAKQLWNQTTQEFNFKHDDIPPKTPSFTTVTRDIYFEEARFDFKKERNVTYETFLNGKPVDLTKPVTEDGAHMVEVVATKENGLKANRRHHFSIDSETFTQDEMDTFIDFFFDDEAHGTLPLIYKWTGSVMIYTHGKATKEDLKQLDDHVKTLNKLLPITLKVVTNDDEEYARTMDIHFIPTTSFRDFVSKDDYSYIENSVGMAYPTEITYEGGLAASTILVGTDITQYERNHVILHELAHSLGMYNHFEDDLTSILYPYVESSVTGFNEMDLKMIKMLYRKDIRPGMTKPDVEFVFNPRVRDE